MKDGTYTIEATTYNAGETGDFTLTVSAAGAAPGDGCGETAPYDGWFSGQWAAGCDSSVSGRGYARYYTFTLDESSEVFIDLQSDDADPYLYLREEQARSGDFLYENNDRNSDVTTSQIRETLVAGTYTIEATTFGPDEEGSFDIFIAGLGRSAPIHEGDRAVLEAFYNATGGPSWANNAGWLTDAALTDAALIEWYGITTDAEGRVVWIDLPENSITGQIPAQLGNLTNLRGLFLWGNELSGGYRLIWAISPT